MSFKFLDKVEISQSLQNYAMYVYTHMYLTYARKDLIFSPFFRFCKLYDI